MRDIRVFISSVQAEFVEERRFLCEYIRSDVLLGKFFVPFIFEELPANNLSAKQMYLREVEMCDVYIGLFGQHYGYEDEEGVSPTEREFDVATRCCKTRLVFIKRLSGSVRHEKEDRLIRKAEQILIRKSFTSFEELRGAVYASLINYLARKNIFGCYLLMRHFVKEPRWKTLTRKKWISLSGWLWLREDSRWKGERIWKRF